MLAKDWPSFDFSYTLDMQRLIPHIVAIEEYRTATLTPVLPPGWLHAADGAESAVGGAAVPEPLAARAAASLTPDAAVAAQPQPDAALAGRKPVRETSVAGAWVKQRFAPGSVPLSLADILTIHRMVAEQSGVEAGNVGALRTSGVGVGRMMVGGVHLGAPAERLPVLMDQYIDFVNGAGLRALHPVIHALLAHFFFDTIHPFRDGNGRTARLIAAAVLFQHGYRLHGTYALIRYFYRHDVRYHKALHYGWKRCPFEVTPFVAFGMEGFVTELKSVDCFVKMKLNRIVDRSLFKPALRERIGARRRAAN